MARFEELDRLKIPLEDIILATNNFAKHNFIGMGGFGRVYKGQLLRYNSSGEPISTTIAVKRLAEGSTGQGVREFRKEIIMLARYKHTNLVSLVGFSDESGEKIIAYKYEVNGSLDRHLASKDLTCDQRLQICLGAARGLEYLHDSVGIGHRVLHRDIKSANILLDENWEAKISDLGLSTTGPKNLDFSFLASLTCGTLGYVDPQYVKTGVLSKESDVYSLGVVIFEVLCGRLAVNSQYHDERRFLSNLVRRHYEEGKIEEIIMTDVREQMNNPYSLQMISRVAYECLNDRQDQRPSIRRLVQELKSSLEFKNGSSSPTTLYGSSTGGSPWSYLLDNNLKLRKLTIDHKDWIFSIAFTIEDLTSTSGSFISCCEGGAGGPSDGQISEISFDADEEIIQISGTVGVITGNHPDVVIISSLCIVTNKRRHGSFGKETGTSFSVPFDAGSFAGFYGRSGFYLDGLGFYSRRS
ncbi:putative serine/threonine-protein kinase PBL28 [Bidens hawaiensis]|uniref:putative serine/threonine-protein kinase PBL28 n=1 Tax=Bidens hawaiensis TaxID=980011 RepID=UPI00404A2280